jgi:hypothetical protein
MNQEADDDGMTAASGTPISALDADEESELARRAGAGDQQAFDLLYDRYFARTSWYFTIFPQREAKVAIAEVLTELFGSLGEPSVVSLAERVYRLSLATELRRALAPEKVGAKKAKPAKVQVTQKPARKVPTPRL